MTTAPLGVLHRATTPYQRIALTRDRRGLLLTLNGSPQVHSAEEAEYHDCIATVPMLLARGIDDVVILGGGDGLAARNILDFPGVRRCTLVELDAGMIELCGRDPHWRRINHGALTDRRLEVVTGDALAWIHRQKRRFDVIVNDVEISFTDQPETLTMDRCVAFFTDMYDHLKPGGILVITVADDTDEGLPDGVFAAERDTLPATVQRSYARLRGVIAKVRLLLQARYRHVRELTISPRALGTHTTFYVSNRPLRRLRRQPPLAMSRRTPVHRLFAP